MTSPHAIPTIDETIEYWNKLVLKNDNQDRAKEQNIRVMQGVCTSVLDKLEGALLSLASSKWETEQGPKRLGAAVPGGESATYVHHSAIREGLAYASDLRASDWRVPATRNLCMGREKGGQSCPCVPQHANCAVDSLFSATKGHERACVRFRDHETGSHVIVRSDPRQPLHSNAEIHLTASAQAVP